jgi:hypothetical protein
MRGSRCLLLHLSSNERVSPHLSRPGPKSFQLPTIPLPCPSTAGLRHSANCMSITGLVSPTLPSVTVLQEIEPGARDNEQLEPIHRVKMVAGYALALLVGRSSVAWRH